MGVGNVHQEIFIRELPKGVTMTITNVNLIAPEPKASWWATFSTGKESIYFDSTPEHKAQVFPYVVSIDANEGKVGKITLSTTSIFDYGPGPSARVYFIFTGSVNKDGVEHKVDQAGELLVATSEWGAHLGPIPLQAFSRPDDTTITYSLAGSSLETKTNHNKFGVDAKGIELLVAYDPESNKLALAGLLMDDFWKDAIGYVINGIFSAHTAGLKWVFGAL